MHAVIKDRDVALDARCKVQYKREKRNPGPMQCRTATIPDVEGT